jgi:hypothetical protein
MLWGRWPDNTPSAIKATPTKALDSPRAKAWRSAVKEGTFVYGKHGYETVDFQRVLQSHGGLTRTPLPTPAAHGADFPDPDFSFLAWPQPHLLGQESVRTRKCWVIDFTNPGAGTDAGPWSIVRLHVDRDSEALMRLQCYDWNKKRLLNYSVTRGKIVNGLLMAKSANATHYKPGSSRKVAEVEYHLP